MSGTIPLPEPRKLYVVSRSRSDYRNNTYILGPFNLAELVLEKEKPGWDSNFVITNVTEEELKEWKGGI